MQKPTPKPKMLHGNMSRPDETREFPKGKVDIVKLGDTTFGRAVLQPGWSWAKCVKPLVQTSSCGEPHTQYVISGELMVVMDDGTRQKFGPGDVGVIPPGHDAYVVGNKPCEVIDFTGMTHYAVPKT